MTDDRLDEYTKTEWLEIMRKVKPDLTDDEFEAEWAEFVALKARRHLN